VQGAVSGKKRISSSANEKQRGVAQKQETLASGNNKPGGRYSHKDTRASPHIQKPEGDGRNRVPSSSLTQGRGLKTPLTQGKKGKGAVSGQVRKEEEGHCKLCHRRERKPSKKKKKGTPPKPGWGGGREKGQIITARRGGD